VQGAIGVSTNASAEEHVWVLGYSFQSKTTLLQFIEESLGIN
jgi:ABC-type phosphate/phosphonate transport system ATPase subunit